MFGKIERHTEELKEVVGVVEVKTEKVPVEPKAAGPEDAVWYGSGDGAEEGEHVGGDQDVVGVKVPKGEGLDVSLFGLFLLEETKFHPS